MCELCTAPPPSVEGQRRKLWEIRPDLHCSVIGTCLNYPDLLKIGRRAGFVPSETATEYEVHNYFVHRAEEPHRLARLMQKTLDTKYRAAIHASQMARCEAALAAFWSSSLTKGDVPGPYWALVTHPLVTDSLIVRAFGDVHMLSHLTGAANRADAKRQQSLETALAEAKLGLTAQAAEQRRAAAEHADDVAALEHQLRAAGADGPALAAAEARLREFENGEAHRALERAEAKLTADLEDARRAGERSRQRCDGLERELSELRQAYREAAAGLKALGDECSALEATLSASIHSTTDPPRAETPAIDLCGRRIAYVGGRAGAVGHFRALVENLNGRFSHHDGGVDDNIARLGGILSQADVVLCPVDCVSHGACLKAKTFCKQTAKPFVPLRTAGCRERFSGFGRAKGWRRREALSARDGTCGGSGRGRFSGCPGLWPGVGRACEAPSFQAVAVTAFRAGARSIRP